MRIHLIKLPCLQRDSTQRSIKRERERERERESNAKSAQKSSEIDPMELEESFGMPGGQILSKPHGIIIVVLLIRIRRLIYLKSGKNGQNKNSRKRS